MTKRHFKDIAQVLQSSALWLNADKIVLVDTIQLVRAMADTCRAYNSNFDRGRFYDSAIPKGYRYLANDA